MKKIVKIFSACASVGCGLMCAAVCDNSLMAGVVAISVSYGMKALYKALFEPYGYSLRRFIEED